MVPDDGLLVLVTSNFAAGTSPSASAAPSRWTMAAGSADPGTVTDTGRV